MVARPPLKLQIVPMRVTDLPAVHVVAQVSGQTGVAPAPTGVTLQAGQATAARTGNVFLAQLFGFA